MTELLFTKMHGTGNDFIIIDNRDRMFKDKDLIQQAPALCSRRFGIGADGIIALQKPDNPTLDYTMFYRNADGSDAGMCGNGARCLALFAAKAGLGYKLSFNVHKTIYEAAVNPSEQEAIISFPMEIETNEVTIKDEPPIHQVYAGTEHIVLEVSARDFKNKDKLKTKGQSLRYHNQFNPPGTNVNFIKGISSNKIRLKTYEKGVENLTLACGTGAIAAAIAWHHIRPTKATETSIDVYADGGTLHISFNFDADKNFYSNIRLKGSAKFVFEGRYAF